ncbi:hypothetical protein B4914_19390 [Yersinia entomophaga]|nr:hypothetical protein B4914_19390 [Yersinia entomophaga]
MTLSFTVLAGKPDNDDGAYYENIKFCDSADSMELRRRLFRTTSFIPIRYVGLRLQDSRLHNAAFFIGW